MTSDLEKKSLSEILPMEIFDRIHTDIGEATMCWVKTPKGTFDSERASKIAFGLCYFITEKIARARREEREKVLGVIYRLIPHALEYHEEIQLALKVGE
jgi:hypothetical protein